MRPGVEINQEECEYYAGFMSHLNRRHFDALYWTLFILVIFSLFISTWVYQRTMRFRDKKPETDEAVFQKKVKTTLVICTAIFLVTAALCVIEVHALLALQFCDGEELMSLFWSTWTMLQLGSEMAILGIVLALWHSIVDIKHPMWALALGTPVLVVAGFGHVIQHFCELCWKRAKGRRRNRKNNKQDRNMSCVSTVVAPSTIEREDPLSSSATSIKPEQEQIEESQRAMRQASVLEAQSQTAYCYFALDVGNDERVRAWPSFVGMSSDGKAVLQLTQTTQGEDYGIQPGTSSTPVPQTGRS